MDANFQEILKGFKTFSSEEREELLKQALIAANKKEFQQPDSSLSAIAGNQLVFNTITLLYLNEISNKLDKVLHNQQIFSSANS